MNNERYEESADMRLLALERARLGMAPPREADWQQLPPDEEDLQILERPAPVPAGQKLGCSLDASPSHDLVTGAVVTLTLSIVNEGTAPVEGCRVTLPLPPSLRYRAGTLMIDGRHAEESLVDALLGADGGGLGLTTLAANARTTILARFVMGGGTEDVAVTATIDAPGTPVSGGRAIRLRRGTGASGFAALLAERAEAAAPESRPASITREAAENQPFYELDPEEEIVFEAADAALSPAAGPSPATMPLPSATPSPAATPSLDIPVPTFEAMLANANPAPRAGAPPKATPADPMPSAPEVEAPERDDVSQGQPELAVDEPPSPARDLDAPPRVDQVVHPQSEPHRPHALVPPQAPDPPADGRPPLQSREDAPRGDEPALTAFPAAPAAPAPPAASAAPPAEAAAPVEPEPPAIRGLGAPVLRVTLDEARLRTLASLFSGARPLGMLAHYLVLNALAAVQPVGSETPDRSLAKFAADQERLLTRALVSVRMQREVDLDSVTTDIPSFPPQAPEIDGPIPLDDIAVPFTLTLYRAFRPGELRTLGHTIEGGHVAPFLRNALLIAGCCANGLARAESPIVRTTEGELTEYASAAAGEVNRLFVRARLTRKSDFFAPPAPSLDDRARSLIAAMQRTLDT